MIAEVKQITTRDNYKLHCSIIENGSPVWLIVSHGLGEHGDRHSYFFEYFSQYFNICIYDLRGHGKSSGKRGHLEEFSEFTDDLQEVVQYIKSEYSMKRYVLFGHSMGALVTSSFMQKTVKTDSYPEKVFLSAPPVAAAGPLGKIFAVAPLSVPTFLSEIKSSVALAGMLDIKKLSHDTRVYEDYIRDELNVLKIHTRLFFNILKEAREVFSKPLRVSCDLYCAVGTSDVLIDPNALIHYF